MLTGLYRVELNDMVRVICLKEGAAGTGTIRSSDALKIARS